MWTSGQRLRYGSRVASAVSRSTQHRPPVAVAPEARAASAWRDPVLAVVSGVLLTLTIPPFDLHSLIWVALLPLLHACEAADRPRTAAGYGTLTGLTLALGVDHGLVAFDWGLFVYGMVVVSLVVGSVMLAYRTIRPRLASPALGVLVLPCVWILGEWLSINLDVPWSAALTQVASLPVIQGAAVVGMLGIAFVVILVASALFEASRWLVTGRAPAGWVGMTLLVVAVTGLDLGYGWRCLANRAAEPGLRVATIQPVIASEVYRYHGLNPAYRRMLRDVVGGLSQAAAARRPQLLVWSEGGNGLFNVRVPAERQELGDLARRSGATLLAASYDLDEQGRLFNSVFSIAPDGTLLGRYDKVWLAPIGERQFSPGSGFRPLPTPQGPIGTLVCFESCFAGPARALAANGAVLLAVTTSDAAFGRSSLPLLHGLFAVFRAVENRRALVQAANTGPSFIVTPFGEVSARLPLFARSVLEGQLSPNVERTTYTRFGDMPLLLVVAAILAVAGWLGRRATSGGHAHLARDASESVRPAFVWVAAAAAATAGGLAAAGLSLALVRGQAAQSEQGRAWSPSVATIPADAAHEFVQSRPNTCGVAALAYLLSYLGMELHEADLLPGTALSPDGVSMAELATVARAHGVDAWGEWQNFEGLREAPKPLIAHVRDDHYVVVLSVRDGVDVFDPAVGYVRVSEDDFRRLWKGNVLVVRFRPISEISPRMQENS